MNKFKSAKFRKVSNSGSPNLRALESSRVNTSSNRGKGMPLTVRAHSDNARGSVLSQIKGVCQHCSILVKKTVTTYCLGKIIREYLHR